MEKGKLLYEGKAKQLYATANPDELIVHFKDDATAFDGAKKGTIGQKGAINCRVTSGIYEMLARKGVKTHHLKKLGEREELVRHVQILPIEVVIRNWAAGSLSKRLGIAEGTKLAEPLQEFFYKNDELHDPMINENHIRLFKWATDAQVAHLKREALRVNEILTPFFDRCGIILVDYKLEFGVASDGEILLADEITPDGCRLWDKQTLEKLDKDRFRRDLGKVEEAYQEVANRVIEALKKEGVEA